MTFRPPPLISIVTVVLNDREGLERTHDSLTQQTHHDFEWLVIDGGSTDGTLAWLHTWTATLDWWQSRPDHGPYDAMNQGLARARGRFVLFLNAGDRLAHAGILGRVAAWAEQPRPADIIYGDAWEETRSGQVLSKPARHHRHAWYGMFAHHQAILYRRQLLHGLCFDLRYAIGADYRMTLQALERARTVLHLPFPFAHLAPAGLSVCHAQTGREDQRRIRRELFGHGVLQGWCITGAQYLAFALRYRFPALFALWRCSASKRSGMTPKVTQESRIFVATVQHVTFQTHPRP